MYSSKEWLFKLLFLIVASSCVLALFGHLFFVKPVYNVDNIILKPTTKSLIVGASHSATAINPEHFENTESISVSGEPIFFTYYKTKSILKNNPQVEKLVIALSPIHISHYVDKFFFKGDAGSRQYAMDYYMFIDNENDPLLPTFSSDRLLAWLKYKVGVPFNYMEDLRVFVYYYLGKYQPKNYSYFGGFENQEQSYLEKDRTKNKAKFYFYGDKADAPISHVGRESIRRIAQLSHEQGIDLIIVNTPMHGSFRAEIPENVNQAFSSTINELTSTYANITFFDYSLLPLEDKAFLDGDHLNIIGAEILSEKLNQRLLTNK